MKIRVASDLHFEFHEDGGAGVVRELAAGEFDVLVVAGDLTNFAGLDTALSSVCRSVAPKPVVYVLGNHEAYGGSRKAVFEGVERARASLNNLVFLEQDIATVLGRRFVGCTLWFPHSGARESLDEHVADFQTISDIRSWLPGAAKASAEFLEANVRSGDVVVTHHLPHPRSIALRFARSRLNPYFLHDVSATVETAGAALWIHGHTHTSCDYVAGTTRVVCNPLGYPGFFPGEPNPEFRTDLDLEV
jgi:predicted phosphodiesterase